MAAALRERVMAKLKRKDAAASPLEGHMRRATQAGGVDVPEDAMNAIIQASNNEDDRREIMRHLRESLSESAACQWRRVYTGIMVLEELLKRGSPDLVIEAAGGVHFDLTQRLGFLEKYEYGYDNRVQSLIQRRAAGVRAIWLEKQLAASVSEGNLAEAGDANGASATFSSASNSDTHVEQVAAPAPPVMDLLDGGDLLDEDDDNVATAAAAFIVAPAAAVVKDADLLGDGSTTDGGESAKSSNRSNSPLGSASVASSSGAPAAARPTDVVDLLFGEPPAAVEVAAHAAPAAAPAAPKPQPPALAEVDWLKIAAEHGLLEPSTEGASLAGQHKPQTSNSAGCNLLDF